MSVAIGQIYVNSVWYSGTTPLLSSRGRVDISSGAVDSGTFNLQGTNWGMSGIAYENNAYIRSVVNSGVSGTEGHLRAYGSYISGTIRQSAIKDVTITIPRTGKTYLSYSVYKLDTTKLS